MASRSRAIAIAAWAATFLLAAGRARADGAFPDSGQVLLLPDRSNEIIVGTNFGLISTSDGGLSWEWTCETPLLTQGQFYQLGGIGVSGRIIASSLWGVVFSDDGSCSFQGASGGVTETTVTDVFVDRAHPERVLAIGIDQGQTEQAPYKAFASADGGVTFGAPIFTAPPETALLGIEDAAVDAQTIYLALHATGPALARTRDGGVTWNTIDLAPIFGDRFVRIVAVDPENPEKIFLRVTGGATDALAVSIDGGLHWSTSVDVQGSLTGFLRRADGTILVGAIAADGTAVGRRSRDGGSTFEAWPNIPHLRALAERAGMLYAVADNFADGFALAVSSDGGATFQPLLAYDRVTRIKPCVASACQNSCQNSVRLGLWPASVCGDQPPTDAGANHDNEGGMMNSDPHAARGCALPIGTNADTAFLHWGYMLALLGATRARQRLAVRRRRSAQKRSGSVRARGRRLPPRRLR